MKVIGRVEWGARGFTTSVGQNTLTRESVCFLHHSEFPTLPKNASRREEIARMKQIESVHMDERGWSAIAYSYVVFPSGRAYVGRGFGVVPAAQYGYNAGNGAICLDGQYETSRTSWAQRKAIVGLLRSFKGRFVGLHRDVNDTSCPGDHVAQVASRVAFLAGKRRYK